MPTSLSVPWSKNVNHDDSSKFDKDLKALYAEVGLDNGKDTNRLCRIGERSSLTWFVPLQLLGHEKVKNFDGSWSAYGSLVGVPWPRRRAGCRLMCGATAGGFSLDGINVAEEATIQGQVV